MTVVSDVIIFIDEGRMKMLSAFGELKNATHIYNDSALYYRFKRMEVHTPHKYARLFIGTD